MRTIEALLILIVMILFISNVNIMLLSQENEYELSLITYSRILAYNILNCENIDIITDRITKYPNIVYVSINSTSSASILKTHENFVVTVRGFLLGKNGTLSPSWVIIGVRP